MCPKQRLAPSAVRVDVLQRLGIGMLERVESRQAQALGNDETRSLWADGGPSCKDSAGQ